MTYRTKIILLGFALSFISLIAYAALRMDYFEDQFTRHLKDKNTRIIKKYQTTFEEKEIKKLNNEELSAFLNAINREVPDTGMLAIADTEKNIKISSKNDALIQSTDIYDLILHDFTGNKLRIKEPGGYIARYYSPGKEQAQKKIRFYIFNNNMGTGTLLAVFPHKPDKVIITKASLEISLMLLLVVILCMMVLILHEKKKTFIDEQTRHEEERKMKLVNRSIEREERSRIRESVNTISEGLSSYVYDLFKEINRAYHTRSISLYVTSSERSMAKLFEYKGNSFLKIDSPVFDAIDLDSDLGRELIHGTPIILQKGEKIVLPLVHGGSLLGTIQIMTGASLGGDQIDGIKHMSDTVLKQLGEYMVLSNVMADRATGMYSETYFKLKLKETEQNSIKTKKDFSLILISIARNIKHLGEADKNAVYKTIAPLIGDEIRENHLICRYARFIAVLLPESGSLRASKTARRLFRVLSDLRIMISDDEYLDIIPYIGLASSDTTDEPRNVLDIAQRNIDLALTRDDANIQDSRIKV